jgi:hypothetical protein
MQGCAQLTKTVVNYLQNASSTEVCRPCAVAHRLYVGACHASKHRNVRLALPRKASTRSKASSVNGKCPTLLLWCAGNHDFRCEFTVCVVDGTFPACVPVVFAWCVSPAPWYTAVLHCGVAVHGAFAFCLCVVFCMALCMVLGLVLQRQLDYRGPVLFSMKRKSAMKASPQNTTSRGRRGADNH